MPTIEVKLPMICDMFPSNAEVGDTILLDGYYYIHRPGRIWRRFFYTDLITDSYAKDGAIFQHDIFGKLRFESPVWKPI